MNDSIKIIQKAAIKKDGKFLVLLRSDKMRLFPLHWDFPGGTLNKDESLIDGFKRELKEEMNVEIKKIELDSEFELDFKDGIRRVFKIFKVDEFSGEIKLSFEHEKYAWLAKEDILKLKIEPFLKKYLEEKR